MAKKQLSDVHHDIHHQACKLLAKLDCQRTAKYDTPSVGFSESVTFYPFAATTTGGWRACARARHLCPSPTATIREIISSVTTQVVSTIHECRSLAIHVLRPRVVFPALRPSMV